MSQTSNNPLAKHFRQPSLYIKLTSGGRYWKQGSLELPVTGELPVYPMTTKDEITLRTPDALINGTSVVNVIQSCCPSIKNAWDMPSIDVDSTLIAIRIASYGPNMSIGSICPQCGEEHDYEVNLPNILSTITAPDYSKTVDIDDGLVAKMKPLTYAQISQSGSVVFEEEKLIQTLADPDLDPEVRKVQYDAHVQKMIDLNLETIVNCTESITTEDGNTVNDSNFIKEFYANAKSDVLRKLQAVIKEYGDTVSLKPLNVACDSCGHQFQLSIDFDYASFFDQGF